MIQTIRNLSLEGADGKTILMDIFFKKNNQPKPVVVFSHGYKGFKDWGCWDLAAEQFAENDCFFVKFNFSHNGTTPQNPLEFGDLEAFGHNNFTKELFDLEKVINWVCDADAFLQDKNPDALTLIGHSRGGGVCALKAGEDTRVSKLITWAGVSDFGSRFPTGQKLEKWKETGVMFIENARTKQQMPHYYQFYQDFQNHSERLFVEAAVKRFNKPQMVLHGEADSVISVEEAKKMHRWNPKSKLIMIPDADHVFGGKHPYPETTLPAPFQILTQESILFVKTD
ncbi:MAG: alpha/beta hydrolase [Bacteroidetes bacterium]|nr:alpha/beta hydrolase [Bacteroidota bacterium]